MVVLTLLMLTPAHAQNVGIMNGAAGCPYETIAGAMKSASPGDFLLLRTGFRFEEGVSLEKDLTFSTSDPLCISVSPAAPRAVIAPSTGRAIDSRGHDLTLMRVDVRGGSGVAEAGGVIRVGGTSRVKLFHSRVTGGTALEGGGVYVDPEGSLRMWNSFVIDNAATSTPGRGGGIYSAGGLVRLIKTRVHGNDAVEGAGLWSSGAKVIIEDGKFTNNTAIGDGGGVYVESDATGGMLKLITLRDRPEFTGNVAFGNGGAIAARALDAVFLGGLWADTNFTFGNGGAIAGWGAAFTGSEVELANNFAGGSGGAIWMDGGSIDVAGAATSNVALGEGGGSELRSDSAVLLVAKMPEFFENSAFGGRGGGLLIDATMPAAVTASIHANFNSATGDGGGIAVIGTAVDLSGAVLVGENNRSERHGGGVYLEGPGTQGGQTLSLGMIVSHNSAAGDGGGLAINCSPAGAGPLVLRAPSLQDNRDAMGGPGAQSGAGAAVWSTDGSCGVKFTDPTLRGNEAAIAGGGLGVWGPVEVELKDANFRENEAPSGGGLALLENGGSGAPRVIFHSELNEEDMGTCVHTLSEDGYCTDMVENTATDGGAIYVAEGRVEIAQTALLRNEATNDGSAIFAAAAITGELAVVVLENVMLIDNGRTSLTDAIGVGDQGVLYGEYITFYGNGNASLRYDAGSTGSLRGSAVGDPTGVVVDGSVAPLPGGCNATVVENPDLSGANAAGLVHTSGQDFVDASAGDFRPTRTGMLFDACSEGPDLDIYNLSRPMDDAYDIGAIEVPSI